MKTRRRWVVGPALGGLLLGSLAGCGDQGNTKIIDAPAVAPGESKPVPADVKAGGGKGSSGNMNRNPGASS